MAGEASEFFVGTVVDAVANLALVLDAAETGTPGGSDAGSRRAVIDAQDDLGMTALHHAAIAGHQAVVKLLISRGADLAVNDNKGRTALDHCRQFGQ